ncbi:MAG: hypothetical protein MJZ99_00940 [Bacteroidales bacterium]|nr:hypothetical protein [Bacteroidales bacterium]
MAILKEESSGNLSGKLGRVGCRNTKHGTVMVQLPDVVVNPRTPKQQRGRLLLNHLTRFFTQIKPELPNAFEIKAPNHTDTNAFVSANYHGSYPVFLPELWRQNYASVLAPYRVTDGYLPSVEVVLSGSGYRTNISLDGLALGPDATVGDWAEAILENNDDYHPGDEIIYLACWQRVSPEGVPQVAAKSYRLVLDPGDERLASAVLPAEGFGMVDGFLGQPLSAGDAADGFAWIHYREQGGRFQISSQYLTVRDLSRADRYGTDEALAAAVASLKWDEINPF